MHATLEYLSLAIIALLALYHHRRLKRLHGMRGAAPEYTPQKQTLLFVLYAMALSTTGVLLIISCLNNFVSYLSEAMAFGCILTDFSITLIHRKRWLRLQAGMPGHRSFADYADECAEPRFSRYRIITAWMAFMYMAVAVITAARICMVSA